MPLKGISFRFVLALALVVFLASPWPVRAQAAPPEKPESGIASPQALPQGFDQGIAQLQESLKAVGLPRNGRNRKPGPDPKGTGPISRSRWLLQKPPWSSRSSPCSRSRNFLVTYGDREKDP